MATANIVTNAATFDGQLEYDFSQKFAPLPMNGNLSVGVTETETIYLWRRMEQRDDRSTRLVADVDKVTMLLVSNPATTGRRYVRAFSHDGLIENDRVENLVRLFGFTEKNSIWRVIPEEIMSPETWDKLGTAWTAACGEYAFNKFVDAVASTKFDDESFCHDA